MVHIVKSKADFEAQLKAAENKLVVVDFYATWCGPCKQIAPEIEKFATQFKDEVVFLKVDVDETDELAAEYEIEAMPTFVYIKNKKVLEKFSGANQSKVKETVERLK